jgi:hypothetical protein
VLLVFVQMVVVKVRKRSERNETEKCWCHSWHDLGVPSEDCGYRSSGFHIKCELNYTL